MEELEPLLGAAVDLECDDWVFIPGELGGMPCEKLLLKSVKLVKCPTSRGVEYPVEISKKIWTLWMWISGNALDWKERRKNTSPVSTEGCQFIFAE